MNPLEAVLFDVVGTLIELREPVGESYARASARHGVELPAWRLDDAFTRVVARAGAPDASDDASEREWWWRNVRDVFRATDQTVRFADFDALFEELWAHYGTADAWQMRPYARETLAALRAEGLRLGLVSNFDHRLEQLLDALEITGLFETVTRPGTAGCRKPAPGIFAAACQALDLPAACAAFVGNDRKTDAEGAARAGLLYLDVDADGGLETLPLRLRAATLGGPGGGP